MALVTRLVSSISANLTKQVNTTNEQAYVPYRATKVYSWPDGSGDQQASKAFQWEQTVNSGGFASIPLTTISDFFGVAAGFTEIKAIHVEFVSRSASGSLQVSDNFDFFNDNEDTITLAVPNDGSNPGDSIQIVRPAGRSLTPTTRETLTIGGTGGGTVTARITVIGS